MVAPAAFICARLFEFIHQLKRQSIHSSRDLRPFLRYVQKNNSFYDLRYRRASSLEIALYL